MKILLFTDTLGDLNGVSRFIQDMGELAEKNGIELLIATSTSKPLPAHAYIRNLPFLFKIRMPFYQELDLVWPHKKEIKALLQEVQPDLVHISTPGPFGWIAKSIAQQQGYPLIGTYHTDFPAYIQDLTGSAWVKRLTDKMMARFYAPFVHVFSRSEQYLEVMANDLSIGYEKTSVIYPGTNLKKFNPLHQSADVWKHYGLSAKRSKVLYVGRINIEKNIPFLTQVWQQLNELFPEIKADLVMVGEGRYRKWADRLRSHHAYFLGPVIGENLSKLYASADLFIFPSVTDTLGQVIMEAQASGLPCLVSDVGGPQTLIVENRTGQVIKADDMEIWLKRLADELVQLSRFENNEVAQRNHTENTKLLCVEHMQQYNIAASFEHFIAKHEQVLKSLAK